MTVLFCLSVSPTYAFNSNLPPPWLVRTTTINPISTGSATKSSPTKKSAKSSSNEKVNEPSPNSGSPASTDQKPTNPPVARTLQDKSKSQEQKVDSSDKDVDEKAESSVISVDTALRYTRPTYTRSKAHTTLPATGAFGIQEKSLKTVAMSPLMQAENKIVDPSVKPHFKSLMKMCRLSNIPGVILLHVVGTYVATSALHSSAFLATLFQPSMLVVLASLLILSSSSMVINDYYDSRTGVDLLNAGKRLQVPAPVIKRFLSYLYTTLLTALVFLPGKITRMSVVFGSLLTFWYTQHLKPKTWIKNVSCAGLIALSPFTSAAAASYIQGNSLVQALPKILQLSTTIFLGVMGREIWMDVLDEDGDRKASIQTIPVKYGKRIACRVAFALSFTMALISNVGHLVTVLNGEAAWRSLAFSSMGSAILLTRATQIMMRGGMNSNLTRRAIEEGKLVIFFVLASYVSF